MTLDSTISKVIHVYASSCEYAYPKYLDRSLPPDSFDEEIMCNTDLEVRYLRGLHELGIDCNLLYPRRFSLPRKTFTHRGGYKITRFPIDFFEARRGELCLGMLDFIRKERPDLVHFHAIYGGGYFPVKMFDLIVWQCRRLHIPVFGWYHIGTLNLPGKARVPPIRALYRRIRINTIRGCSGITSINRTELGRLFNPDHPEYYGVDFSSVPHRQTANTYDSRYFYSVEKGEATGNLGLDPSKRYLLIVCRLFRQKGLHYIVEVMPDILRQHPECHLIVVGEFIEGSDEYEREVKAMIAELHLEEAITFVGRIEHQQGLRDYYCAASAFVLPTYMDSFAAVNIEAMACGVPVISTDREEIPHYLKPGVGRLVPQHDAVALRDAVLDVLSGRFVMDEDQRRTILAEYDYLTAARGLREWYAEILAGERRGGRDR